MKKILRRSKTLVDQVTSTITLRSLVTWGFRIYEVWEILRFLFKH
jgi:hypothetical protein